MKHSHLKSIIFVSLLANVILFTVTFLEFESLVSVQFGSFSHFVLTYIVLSPVLEIMSSKYEVPLVIAFQVELSVLI